MFRVGLSFASLLLLSLQTPAVAQTSPAADGAPATTCKLSEPKKRGSSMLGGMLGGLANRALGRTGIAGYIPTNTLATTLTDAIACKLDAQEQKQAAAATTEAVRGGVGSTSQWASATRPGVKGSSTVTAQTRTAAGATCMDVNDVIIVNGEETTVSKRMCRAPGASGYTLAA
jgi:predicted lipid-binding transport protein (Tim44 family)